MSLKTVIESTEGLDAALIPFYAENDGKFYLQIEGVDAHPDVMNLKVAYERRGEELKTLKAERDQAKGKIAELPEDFDPEKWEKLKDGKADEAALVELRKTLEAERDAAIAERDEAKGMALKSALDRDLTDALTEAGVTNPAFAKAARTMLSGDVRINDEGKPVVDTDMGPIDLAQHVKRWTSGEGKAFVDPGKGGGGKGGDGGGVVTKEQFASMGDKERTELFRSDPDKFKELSAP